MLLGLHFCCNRWFFSSIAGYQTSLFLVIPSMKLSNQQSVFTTLLHAFLGSPLSLFPLIFNCQHLFMQLFWSTWITWPNQYDLLFYISYLTSFRHTFSLNTFALSCTCALTLHIHPIEYASFTSLSLHVLCIYNSYFTTM